MTEDRGRPGNSDARPSVEWDATSYHRVSAPQVAWGERVLDRLSLRGDETVLDAGCGTGRLTAELLERLPEGRVIAVDQSSAMLQQAREHLTPRFGDRVSFIRSDLAALDLTDVADAIFSTATFHWVPDHPQLFRNLYHALRLGGNLVAQCGGGPNLAHLLETAEGIMRSPPYAEYFTGWANVWEFADAATASERLRATGFVDVVTSVEPAPVVLPNAEEYREFIRTVIFRLHLECIPEEALRGQFIDQITTRAAQSAPPFLLDYWRLNLQGRRPG